MDGVIDREKIMYGQREHNHCEEYGDDPMGGGATTAGAAGDAAFERDV